jgi:phage tail sheath protein FI
MAAPDRLLVCGLILAPDSKIHRIPPSGIMAGIYARRDGQAGVHEAPANLPILDAIEVTVPVTEDDLGLLAAEGVNVIKLGRGIRPWGARTASSDPRWRYVNVRRLFIMLRRSIEAGMAWVTFEHNSEKTWESVRDMVAGFLGDLYQRGMFASGKPEDCYFVRCGAETNPPEAVSQGILACEIGVAPAIPAEFIVISVTQNTGGE